MTETEASQVDRKRTPTNNVEDRSGDISFSLDQLDVMSSLSFKQFGTLGTFTPEQICAIHTAYNDRLQRKGVL